MTLRKPDRLYRAIYRRLNAALALSFVLAGCLQLRAQGKPPAPEQPRADEPRVLELGKALEDVLAPEQTKSYQVALSSGQYAEIAIDPMAGLVVTARLLAPQGEEELVVAGGHGDFVTVSVLSSAGGSYRLRVQRSGKRGGEGHYRIGIAELREARPEDATRVAAERLFVQAQQLESDRTDGGLRARLEKYQKALALWRQVGDPRHEALSLLSVGKVYNDLHQDAQALEYLHQALSLSQAMGLKWLAAETVMSLTATYTNQGDTEKALEYCRQALALSREVRDKFGEAWSLMVLPRLDSSGDALQYFQRALDLFRELEDRRGEAYVLNQLGKEYVSRGRQQEGMESLRQCIEVARASNNRYEEAYALQHLADSYAMQGEMRKALDHYLQALPLQRSRGDSWGEAQALVQIGSMYMSLGEMDKALEYSRQALPLWQKVENRDSEAAVLVQVGQVYSGLEDTETALTYFQRALPLYRTLSNHAGEAETLSAMAENHVRQAKLKNALEDYKQAIAIYRTDTSSVPYMRRGEAMALRGLGSVQVSLGQTEEALKSLNRALELLTATGHSVDDQAAVLYQLARAERAANRPSEALGRAKTAVDFTERLRGAVAGVDMRTSYVAKVRDRYELLIALLMQIHHDHPADGYDVQALEISERARARGLLDLLSESHADIRQGVDPVLLERDRSLQASLTFKAAYRIQLLSKTHTEQHASELEKEISAITSQYEETAAQIRARSPRYANLTQPQPLTLVEMQRLLDPGTTLFEYSMGADKSFLWVIELDSLSSFELPKRAEIESLARRAYAEMSINNPGGGQEATIALSRMLLGPAVERLATKRLVIVADGALEYIPFAALETSAGVALVAEHEIVNLPSASTLALLRKETEGRVPAPKQVAVLADPVFSRDDPRVVRGSPGTSAAPAAVAALADGNETARSAEAERPADLTRSAKDAGVLSLDRLPASRREAQTITALAGPDLSLQALDFSASRETAMSPELAQYRVLHVASHTLLNSHHPELSGIVLSLVDKKGEAQDGFLQAREIFNLKLNADLVVLSACQTALGKEVRGEGLVGLARAFMYAGAPRVVASLWRVPDQATSELMQHFYKAMLADGLPPATALRKAQLTLRSEKRWSAPYYWAGFALQGEWK